jgi:SAM-dependent methyltransferase
MDLAENFYDKVLKKLTKEKIIYCEEKILVVAAGRLDCEVFHRNGFSDVLITNIDTDMGGQNYKPYNWEYQDIEKLTYNNNEFDWVFVHAGLHHCSSPHRGLCEMLRVAKKGIGVFEARDSLLNKIAVRFDLVPSFELEPCVLSGGKDGGLRNSNIPNFIYRWTEKEVIKTVNSFLPQYIHKFHFYYGLRIPNQRLAMSPNIVKRFIGYIAYLISPVLKFLFPKQGNYFAFIISKTGEIRPWLMLENGKLAFNLDYIKGRFHPEKYKVK